MNEGDSKRGAAIMAAWRFMALLQTQAGNTSDWPIRIVCDDPEVGAEFARLREDLIVSLNDLQIGIPHDAS